MARMIRHAVAALAVSALPLAAHANDLIDIKPDAVRHVSTSSTGDSLSEGRAAFDPRHLIDGRDWSAWGSQPRDAAGAWVQLDFRALQYVSRIEFVPGNARDKSAYNECGRPARVRVTAGDARQTFDLPDRRYQQVIDLDPPVPARELRLTFERVHGNSKAGGVCISELRAQSVSDPINQVTGLRDRIRRAIEDLSDDRLARRGHKTLVAVGPPATNDLLAALDPRNANLAARAAEVLGEIGDPRALNALGALAAHPDRQLQEAALWGLGAAGSVDHYDAIASWYKRANPVARDRAFEALARSGDPRALDAVVAELVDGPPARQALAAEHLVSFGPAASAALEPLLDSTVVHERAAAILALGTVPHAAARDRLIAALHDGRSEVRAAAIRGLTRRGDREAHALIVDRWNSRFLDERTAVADALGHLGREEDRETLELMTADTAMSVRRTAAQSLARYGEAARPTLVMLALQGSDGGTANAAARSLVEMDGGAAISSATRLLGSRFAEVRAYAGETLLESGAEGRMALVAAVTGAADRERTAAAEHLAAMGPRMLPEIISAAGRADDSALATVLDLVNRYQHPMGAAFAANVVATHPDLTIRKSAVDALVACGEAPEAVPTLIAALDDAQPEVRAAAAQGLGALRAQAAVPRLTAMFNGDDDGDRRAAVRALGALRNAESVAALSEAYEAARHDARKVELRKELVAAIGRIGGRESLSVLMKAMGDTDPRVRKVAEHALY